MKKNAIKIGLITLLTLFVSTQMWSNKVSESENEQTDNKIMTVLDLQQKLAIGNLDAKLANILFGLASSDPEDGFYNSPDPFVNSTEIFYSLKEKSMVTLTVFSNDQDPVVLVNEEQPPGLHSVIFTPNQTSSGPYYGALETGSGVVVEEMED